jgi:hypothetical protein
LTGDEMERAIEFLLQHMAAADAKIAQLAINQASIQVQVEQIATQVLETDRQLGILAQTQNEFIAVVTRFIEGQNRVNAKVQKAIDELASR